MDGEKNKIVVVIISYNGWQYLPDCFRSLEEQTLLPEEIIIVDNNSNDGTKELLANLASLTLKVKIIFNKKNLGFAQANNQGITEALKINPDYIFLLNQDTVCHRECLEQLAKSDSREQVFAKQALILCWPPENGLIQTAGDKIHFLGFGHSGDYRLQVTGYRLRKLPTLPEQLCLLTRKHWKKSGCLTKIHLCIMTIWRFVCGRDFWDIK